jgi:hypothetical protein
MLVSTQMQGRTAKVLLVSGVFLALATTFPLGHWHDDFDYRSCELCQVQQLQAIEEPEVGATDTLPLLDWHAVSLAVFRESSASLGLPCDRAPPSTSLI